MNCEYGLVETGACTDEKELLAAFFSLETINFGSSGEVKNSALPSGKNLRYL
jgi:hypothetical protein